MIGWRIGRLVLTILLVSGCSGAPAESTSDGSVPTPTIPPPTVAAVTAAPTVRATPAPTITLPDLIDMGSTTATVISATPNPDFIVLAGSYAFASGVGLGVGRFNGTSGDLVDSIRIPGDSCEALDAGFGAAWTATCTGPGLARIDGITGRVTTVNLGGSIPTSEASIGAGEEAVWVVINGSPRKLLRVDPATMTVVGSYDLPGSPTAVRAGLGAVWVSDPAKSLILRVDPASGTVVASIKVGRQPQFITVGEGALWTMDQARGTVSRVDPATNTVTATIQLGETVEGGDIAVGGGYVWLRGSRTLLFQIDPATNEIVARYGPNAGSGSVAADDTAVWITAHDIRTVWRLELGGS